MPTMSLIPTLEISRCIKQNAVYEGFCRRLVRKEAVYVKLLSRLQKTLLKTHSLKLLSDRTSKIRVRPQPNTSWRRRVKINQPLRDSLHVVDVVLFDCHLDGYGPVG
jgi:hypothetical protein